jgi:hypothetical protein
MFFIHWRNLPWSTTARSNLRAAVSQFLGDLVRIVHEDGLDGQTVSKMANFLICAERL